MVVSLTSVVSVTWHSVDNSLRVAAKSVVGDSTGREIRELLVKHNDLNTSNNKLSLHYVTVQFIYTTCNHSIMYSLILFYTKEHDCRTFSLQTQQY